MRVAVVNHMVVDLVRHDRDLGKSLQPRDELVHFALSGDAAGRIGRRVQDQEPRLRGDQLERLLGGEGKIVLLADRHRDRPRARVFDHGAVDWKTWIGIEDIGPRFAEYQDRHEHRRLAARQDHHLVGRHAHLEALAKVGGHRFAQRRDADCRGIAVMAVAQRLDRGFNDEIGRAEIGLADAEIDDIAPLGGERVGARQHRKGILLSNAIEGGNGFQHVITSRLVNGSW